MPGLSPNPDAVASALAYLRANGDRFTPDALTTSLREAGYADPDIEEAWRRMHAWQVAPASPTPLWLRFVVAVLVTLLAVAIVAMLAALVVVGSCLVGTM